MAGLRVWVWAAALFKATGGRQIHCTHLRKGQTEKKRRTNCISIPLLTLVTTMRCPVCPWGKWALTLNAANFSVPISMSTLSVIKLLETWNIERKTLISDVHKAERNELHIKDAAWLLVLCFYCSLLFRGSFTSLTGQHCNFSADDNTMIWIWSQMYVIGRHPCVFFPLSIIRARALPTEAMFFSCPNTSTVLVFVTVIIIMIREMSALDTWLAGGVDSYFWWRLTRDGLGRNIVNAP